MITSLTVRSAIRMNIYTIEVRFALLHGGHESMDTARICTTRFLERDNCGEYHLDYRHVICMNCTKKMNERS